MNILIITGDIQQGDFLRKGLQFENINTRVINYDDFENNLGYYDGFESIILALDHFFKIDRVCSLYKGDNYRRRFLLLAGEYNQEILQYAKEKSIKVFFRPYPLRIIANEIRQGFITENLESEKNYIIRDLELNVNTHRVMLYNREIYLRNKEFNLLYYLIINRGKILSRNKIIENVWDRNAEIVTNTVEVHISSLRKKIDKNSFTKYIYTIPCTGYMLN